MIVASNFRRLERNTLKGFVTLALEPSGLIIHDCTVHEKQGKAWIGMPAKPQINGDGTARTDSGSGKLLYRPVLEFKDRTARTRFQQVALEAVRTLAGEGLI
jgi:hypothetical protein